MKNLEKQKLLEMLDEYAFDCTDQAGVQRVVLDYDDIVAIIQNLDILTVQQNEIDPLDKDKALHIGSVVRSAYLVNVDYGQIVVMAENIAEVFDKLEDAGFKGYSLAKHSSLDVL